MTAVTAEPDPGKNAPTAMHMRSLLPRLCSRGVHVQAGLTEALMTRMKFDSSRRNLCRQGVALAGGAVAAGLLLKNGAFAQSQKAPQSAVKYQDHPHGQDECDRCTHFVPGKTSSADGTCQVVQGSISPQGWCVMFASKG